MDRHVTFIFAVFLAGNVLAADPAFPGNSPAPPATHPYQKYHYRADRFYRDPFVPLVGSSHISEYAINRPPQIASLVLKGIAHDDRGTIALLTAGISSYILRHGRLYDVRNRMVKGISGVIKPKSVLLIGRDHTVKEFRIPY